MRLYIHDIAALFDTRFLSIPHTCEIIVLFTACDVFVLPIACGIFILNTFCTTSHYTWYSLYHSYICYLCFSSRRCLI